MARFFKFRPRFVHMLVSVVRMSSPVCGANNAGLWLRRRLYCLVNLTRNAPSHSSSSSPSSLHITLAFRQSISTHHFSWITSTPPTKVRPPINQKDHNVRVNFAKCRYKFVCWYCVRRFGMCWPYIEKIILDEKWAEWVLHSSPPLPSPSNFQPQLSLGMIDLTDTKPHFTHHNHQHVGDMNRTSCHSDPPSGSKRQVQQLNSLSHR